MIPGGENWQIPACGRQGHVLLRRISNEVSRWEMSLRRILSYRETEAICPGFNTILISPHPPTTPS